VIHHSDFDWVKSFHEGSRDEGPSSGSVDLVAAAVPASAAVVGMTLTGTMTSGADVTDTFGTGDTGLVGQSVSMVITWDTDLGTCTSTAGQVARVGGSGMTLDLTAICTMSNVGCTGNVEFQSHDGTSITSQAWRTARSTTLGMRVIDMAPVPLPAGLGLPGSGLAAPGGLGQRRQRRSASRSDPARAVLPHCPHGRPGREALQFLIKFRSTPLDDPGEARLSFMAPSTDDP
jgi:hypothetical protein